MNKLVVSLLLTLGVAGAATAAQPVKGDAAAGQAKTAVCGACHNPDGNSLAPNFRNWPAKASATLKTIARYQVGQAYRAGDDRHAGRVQRPGPGRYRRLLLQPERQRGRRRSQAGRTWSGAVQRWRPGKGMPACTGCHSPNGAGIALAGFPHLGGQHAQYVTKQLTDFREGNRTNDGDAMTMRTIAGKLSNHDIEALASYIQGLH